jgi:hypothetical protein
MTDTARNFSLYDPEIMADPHAVYDELRSTCPVAHSDRDEGFWIASRYADVVAATKDPATFSSRYIMIPRLKFGPDFVERPPITLDPPHHTFYRRLLQPGFTHVQAQKWEPSIRKICRETAAKLAPAGRCELVNDYCKRIPLQFTCELNGVPTDIEPEFTQWCHDVVESAEMEGVLRATGEMAQYLAAQVEQRREQPGDDMITFLMNSEIDGQRLQGQPLIATAMLILIAGLDTTWNALSSAMLHLAAHPADRHRLVEDPSLIPVAVEELLRFYAPVVLTRETTREVELGGTTIPAGELVLLNWAAANRDPEVFPDADRVVIDRAENRHIAFGTGAHRCLGAAIARLELRIAIEEWLAVVPEFELADPETVTYSTGHIWGPRRVEAVWA